MSETRIDNEDIFEGLYPEVFKKIDSTDIQINPFQAHKTFTVLSGSATSSMLPLQGVYIDKSVLPELGSELIYNDAANIDGSLQSISYFSINHLFYKNKNQPYNNFGQTNLNFTKKFLYETASIFSFPQNKIGEGIKLGSFILTVPNTASFTSDRYANIIDSEFNTNFIVDTNQLRFYEGFNEYFDTSRINYESSGVTYVDGVVASNGQQLPMGLAAKFSGSGYISTKLPGEYNRDSDYAISFFISGSNTTINDQLITTKATSSIQPQYPFKIQLSGSNQIKFSTQGSPTYRSMITSSADVSSSWTHVVCQKTGSVMQMYIDGTLHNSLTSTLLENTQHPLSASARIDNFDNLNIGGYNTLGSNVSNIIDQTNNIVITQDNISLITQNNLEDLNLNGLLDEFRIYSKALSATEVAYLADRSEGGKFLQTNVVGNIFEKQGIGVISTIDYRYHNLIKFPFTISYKSTVTLNELGIVARLNQGDFNMSTNVTLTKDDNQTYLGFVSGSDFAPYVTSIGLYNDAGQLLAIAKLAQPIRKRNDIDVNFLVRIDLDKELVK